MPPDHVGSYPFAIELAFVVAVNVSAYRKDIPPAWSAYSYPLCIFLEYNLCPLGIPSTQDLHGKLAGAGHPAQSLQSLIDNRILKPEGGS